MLREMKCKTCLQSIPGFRKFCSRKCRDLGYEMSPAARERARKRRISWNKENPIPTWKARQGAINRDPSTRPRGEAHPHWKGGQKLNKDGYRMILCVGHPKRKSRYIPEHRFVMEKFLGRFLDKNEHVHHIDGNKLNNSIENLRLLSNSEHTRHHWATDKRELDRTSP